MRASYEVVAEWVIAKLGDGRVDEKETGGPAEAKRRGA